MNTFEEIEKINSARISLYESLAKSYKEMLGNLFRDKETEYPDWYKDLLREGKNRCESEQKLAVTEQQHHRGGLNPPFCYER